MQRFKQCTKCKQKKSVSFFGKNSLAKDQLYSWCLSCAKEHSCQRRREAGMAPQKRTISPAGTKWCARCSVFKNYENFHKSKRYKDGYGHTCKDCRKLLDNQRDYHQEKYGISNKQYRELLTKQNNRCASCQDELEAPRVDHCHTTGKVRGVLCHNCNVSLGLLKDDMTRISALLMYLGRGG